MRDHRSARRLHRVLRLEPCEERAMMSIAPYEAAVDDYMVAAAKGVAVSDPANPLHAFYSIRQQYGFTGAGQTVAVIDTGIAYTHGALGGGYGTGYRVVGGWDFAENDANPYDDGYAGAHGTHVAGIIGSTDAKYTGAATDVDLVSLRVFDDAGNGNFGWIEQALQWVHANRNAFENPITTVNISIGSEWNSSNVPAWASLEDEFAQLEADGIFVAVAAGNNFASYNATGLSYPAASSYVVPVGSVDANGTLSAFSQRDDRILAAPGRNVTSTVPDYLGNHNGRDDDFQALSGTSMAAPYVAGASVLLRQALEFAGVTVVSQDLIYNTLKNTADTLFDAITNRSYARINLERAFASILPADEAGSTIGDARQLGTIVDTLSLAGTIGKLNDRDCFTFTAAHSGTLTVSIASPDQLPSNWKLLAGSELILSGDGTSFTIDVVAGRTYTFDIGGPGRLGHYDVGLSLEAEQGNWGAIALSEALNQEVKNGDEFRLQATLDGILSIEAKFDRAQGDVGFEVFRADGQPVGTATATANGLRFDGNVQAGQTYLIRISGQNAHVDFRVANVVNLADGRLSVGGATGDEIVEVATDGELRLSVNGIAYRFDAARVREVNIDGGGGNDRILIRGSQAAETLSLSVGSLNFARSDLRVTASGFENVEVVSGAGADQATLQDSAGHDRLIAAPGSVQLVGSGFANAATGFARVVIQATGGDDEAIIYGSAGNDSVTAKPRDLRISGLGYDNQALGFRAVEVHGFAGSDLLTIFDSAGDDTLIGSIDRVDFVTALAGLSALGFENVRVHATTGNDVANLTGTSGNDLFVSTPAITYLFWTQASLTAQGFDRTVVDGRGGTDTAYLVGSTGAETFTGRPTAAQLVGAGFDVTASGFAVVNALAGGGIDRALLYDSAGDDYFEARSDSARLTGVGYDLNAFGFQQVRAFASGGSDRADLVAAAVDNGIDLSGGGARIYGASYDRFAYGFDRVRLDLRQGRVTSSQIGAVDFALEQLGGALL